MNASDAPDVLCRTERSAQRVARCSPRAGGCGVRPGMTLAEATALMPELQVEHPVARSGDRPQQGLRVEPYAPADDRLALAELAEQCRRFSPLVGLEDSDEPECVYLDATGLGHLLGDDPAWAAAVLRFLREAGLSARLAIADTLGAAWAAAHYAFRSDMPTRPERRDGMPHKPERRDGMPHNRVFIVPPGGTLAVLRPLPVEALRLSPGDVELLHMLGVVRIEQLERIDRAAWASHLGEGVGMRWDQALGHATEPIPAMPLAEVFSGRTTLEYPTIHAETLRAAVEAALPPIAAALRRQDRGALRLECRLSLQGAAAATLSVGMFEAEDSPEHWAGLLRMQLERLRLSMPIDAIDVAAVQTAPLVRRQQDLFAGDGRRQNGRLMAGLVDRLAGRLGPQAVVQVRRADDAQPERACVYMPLIAPRGQATNRRSETPVAAARRRGTRESVDTGDAETTRGASLGPPRPLRLIERPLALPVVAVLPDGPPAKFSYRGVEHRIARAWGPERIETGWWRGPTVARDYYRVETLAGFRFWLFRRLRDGSWFLQGLFE